MTNPKIVNAVGNCLLGNVNNKECMAVNWMGSGAVQLLGYTGTNFLLFQIICAKLLLGLDMLGGELISIL